MFVNEYFLGSFFFLAHSAKLASGNLNQRSDQKKILAAIFKQGFSSVNHFQNT